MKNKVNKSLNIMRYNVILYPFLLAIFPLLFLFKNNMDQVPNSTLWLIMINIFLSSFAVFIIFKLIFKDWQKAGILTTLFVLAFFFYGFIYDLVSGFIKSIASYEIILALVWVALFVLCFIFVARLKINLKKATLILNFFAVVLILISIVNIVIAQVQNPKYSISQIKSSLPADISKPQLSNISALPDIYLIIPDDYGRSDVMKQYFNYDDKQFTDYLRNKGFVIAERSQSNYLSSEFNMNAILNLNYFNYLGDVMVKAKSENLLLQRQMIENSLASRFLESLGYNYIHIDSDITTFAHHNPGISPVDSPDQFNTLLLKKTLLHAFGGPIGFNDQAVNSRIRKATNKAFDCLESTSKLPGPKFVLFHVMPPHDPYVFGANGEQAYFPDNVQGEIHGLPAEMKYYVGQIKYLEKKLISSTEAIIANSKVPPIIIIQSDEGYEADVPVYTEDIVHEIRLKGFSAYYLPGKNMDAIPQNLAGVNTFRFIFDQYFCTNLGLLPVKSYISVDENYYLFEELNFSSDNKGGNPTTSGD
jgi:hypothetical protein